MMRIAGYYALASAGLALFFVLAMERDHDRVGGAFRALESAPYHNQELQDALERCGQINI